MKRFIKKFSLFLLPLILLMFLPVALLIKTGEFIAIDRIIQMQRQAGGASYFGLAFSNYDSYYKLNMMLNLKPELLILGDSRVLQIRKEFFKPGVDFYNAGLIAKTPEEFGSVLAKIPVAGQPKIIIMDLDQESFNGDSVLKAGAVAPTPANDPNNILNIVINSWTQIYSGLFTGKIPLSEVFAPAELPNKIGLTAAVYHEGFRKDGSYRAGRYIEHPNNPQYYDYQFKDSLALIAAGSGYFQYGRSVSSGSLASLDDFLSACQSRGIYVIGYMPPFVHRVYRVLQSDPKFSYLEKIEPGVRSLIEKHGFGFYNFSDLASLGASDAEATDAVHASEKAYLRLLIKIAEQNSALKPYVDVGRLKQDSQSSTSDQEVFKD